MPDHININHPDRHGVESQHYRQRLEITKLKAELVQLRMYYDGVTGDLESIFTRTARGDVTELHYPNGEVYVISGKLSGTD